MKKNQIDTRGVYTRCCWTETTCDHCGEVIMESERRFNPAHPGDEVVCLDCYGNNNDPVFLRKMLAAALQYVEAKWLTEHQGACVHKLDQLAGLGHAGGYLDVEKLRAAVGDAREGWMQAEPWAPCEVCGTMDRNGDKRH